MLREGIQDYEKIKILKTIFQSSDQAKLQTLNTIIQKFTISTGEGYAEPVVNEGQEVLATLSRDLSASDIKKTHVESRKLKIYPNPASENICFEIPDGQVISSIRFFRISGIKVALSLTDESHDNLYSYSLNNIPAGVYFAHVVTKDEAYSGTFIVR